MTQDFKTLAGQYVITVTPDEDSGYVATVPTIPGVFGQGETRQEAITNVENALAFTLECMIEDGEPLPPADPVA